MYVNRNTDKELEKLRRNAYTHSYSYDNDK